MSERSRRGPDSEKASSARGHIIARRSAGVLVALAARTAVNRGSWPVRVYRLGDEPPDDLRPLPDYRRADAPVVLRRLGE